jgi:hypothetical protein
LVELPGGYAALVPSSMLNSFQEIVFDVIQCLPSRERMQFQALFEFTRLKPIVSAQYLLFDVAFPKLHERPIAPQLISHVAEVTSLSSFRKKTSTRM